MQTWYERDADLAVIRGRRVGVLGFGAQGRAHALNLRDSGVDVTVADEAMLTTSLRMGGGLEMHDAELARSRTRLVEGPRRQAAERQALLRRLGAAVCLTVLAACGGDTAIRARIMLHRRD